MTVENLKYFKFIELQNNIIEKKNEEEYIDPKKKSNKTDD